MVSDGLWRQSSYKSAGSYPNDSSGAAPSMKSGTALCSNCARKSSKLKAAMFPEHLKKVTRFPTLGLMMLAGGLVVVCQLLAMVMVAGNPLQNAGVRDLQQVAFADCIQRSTSASRHGCIRQSQLESDDRELAAASPPDAESANTRNLAMTNEDATSDRADKLRVAAAR